jgi:hypothetical protein
MGSPTRRGARQLIATAPTEPALLAPGLPGLDHVWMRAFRTGVHASLPIALVTTNMIGKPIRISYLDNTLLKKSPEHWGSGTLLMVT